MATTEQSILSEAGVVPTTQQQPPLTVPGEQAPGAPAPGLALSDLAGRVFEFLARPCGPGAAKDYHDHALNWAPWSDGLAKAFWGLTGLVGDMNLGVVAIVTGLLEYRQELARRD